MSPVAMRHEEMQTLLCHNTVGHASYPKSGWTSGQKYVTNLFLYLPDDPVSTAVVRPATPGKVLARPWGTLVTTLSLLMPEVMGIQIGRRLMSTARTIWSRTCSVWWRRLGVSGRSWWGHRWVVVSA